MSISLELQNALDEHSDLIVPDLDTFSQWITCACENLALDSQNICLTIRIVTTAESQQLNRDYRHKDRPTNVLSFPYDAPENLPEDAEIDEYLGDLAICADIVEQEAKEQGKATIHHWSHLTVHGFLHLLGFDHIKDEDAALMESTEINILSTLGIDDPYQNH